MKSERHKDILEKISLKNKAQSVKLRAALFEQQEQLEELHALIERVVELKDNTDGRSCDDPSELRAARWYALKLSEQLLVLENRVEFIEAEIEELRSKSKAQSFRNAKLEQLIDEAKSLIRSQKEQKLDKTQDFSRYAKP